MKLTIKNLIILIFTLALTANTWAKVKIQDVSFSDSNGKEAKVSIKMTGVMNETPELTVKDQMIQIAIPNSYVWPKIEKKATISKNFDTTLLAYQYDKDLVRFRVLLPYSLNGKESLVSLTLKDGKIELNFPKLKSKSTSLIKKRKRVSRTKKKSIEKYDESYLEALIKNKEVAAKNEKIKRTKNPKNITDKVNLALSSVEKAPSNIDKSSFSLTGYIGKFVAFLGVILLGFFAVMTLMRKGVLKKGKLGFLNSTKVVEVLNTTYIGPKKSVLMVRAHNQVFLLGSSDKGINLLSEISDVAGLLKEGEKQVSGMNFDTSLNTANDDEKTFKLKEVKTQDIANNNLEANNPSSNKLKSLADLIDGKDEKKSVKFSDQIKSKVKNLKQLQ